MSRGMSVLTAGAILLGATAAVAAPSRWARARDPALDQRQSMLADAEALELKYRHTLRGHRDDEDAAVIAQFHLRKAKDVLEEGGAARARDPVVRYRLAELYHLLQDDAKAVPLLESILRDKPPAPVRADALSALAISYARMGRHEDEIKAYEEALLLEPHSRARATLLANRAEAYMALGDITAAVEGYRAALSLLSSIEMIFGPGATTLWGLAVALDRSGDLDSALDGVRLARTYDPNDKGITGPDWFYVPPYDRYYYQALGHWSAARNADLGAAKAERYGQAIAAWEEYIASAKADDKWLPIARVRRSQCEKERDAFLRAARRRAEPPAEPPLRSLWLPR